MKIINEKKIKESYTAYDIKNLIDNGELGILCDDLLDGLKNAVFQIKETDKLENFFTKYYKSAPEYIRYIQLVTDLLYSAKKKG
jgi:hypothetical protein